MKTISLKKFRESGERMTRAQYEKNCGNEVNSPEVYAYVNFLHIEIHKNKESDNEEFYLVVVGNEDLETHSLLEAETFLYENMKNELPKKNKKEKIDKKKYPRGIDSWIVAHFEISSSMGYYSGAKKESERLELLHSDYERQEFAYDLATEFETTFDGVEFHEKISAFIMGKFFPKKTYKATAETTVYSTLEIKASSQEEAEMLANKYGDKFKPLDEDQNVFDIIKVVEQEE